MFRGLPLYSALRDAGKSPFLANLSFTTLNTCRAIVVLLGPGRPVSRQQE